MTNATPLPTFGTSCQKCKRWVYVEAMPEDVRQELRRLGWVWHGRGWVCSDCIKREQPSGQGIANDRQLLAAEKSHIIKVSTTALSELAKQKGFEMAKLTDIKGVGSESAKLLEAAGVNTVSKLSRRNPANLQKKMAEVNESKNLVRQVPSLKKVASWVEQAKAF